MSLSRRPYAYSRVEKEDPDDTVHRRAQFLINKVMAQAENLQSKKQRPLVRISKLKVKTGKRLKTIKKRVLLNFFVARISLYKRIMAQLKTLKCLLRGTECHG